MTNDEIKEQLELALENLDSYTPEQNIQILMEQLFILMRDRKKGV